MRRIVGAHRAERLVVAGAMVEAQKAYDLGIVDQLALQDYVVPAALTWLQATTALPQGPQRITRAIARADIIQALDGFDGIEMDKFMRGWYSDETQQVLQGLFPRK